MRRPASPTFAAAGAAVGVAVVLVSIMATSGSVVFWEHYACVPGNLLASQYNWTPQLFENAPYGGSVFAQAYSDEGSDIGLVFNGTVALFFAQQQWNLSSVDRVLESGQGPSTQCPTYEVTQSPNLAPWQQSSGCGGCELLGPGNTSDASVPTQFNVSVAGTVGLTSVIFHDAFVQDNDGTVSTCGRAGTEINLTSTNLDFQIPFITPNGRIIVDSAGYNIWPNSIPGFGMNFTYSFPADFGTWQIDNLTLGPGAPGSGLAFLYSPCPD
jgi:hypothetical protein